MFIIVFFFSIKNEIQSKYWARDQCTIHPFAIYYRENDKICEQSLLIIAESVNHNFEAVYQFHQELFKFVRERFNVIQKIIFFSDGAGSQYKNKKNFYQLCQYKSTHNFLVEWHFFATSHGKGPCDGIGGAFKRNAMKTSLQRPFQDQITNAKELFDWAKSLVSSDIVYRFCTKTDYEAIENELSILFLNVKPKRVIGTRQYHGYVPINGNEIKLLRFSASDESDTHNFT